MQGAQVKVKIAKNKFAPPFRSVLFSMPLSLPWSLLNAHALVQMYCSKYIPHVHTTHTHTHLCSMLPRSSDATKERTV